MANYYIEKYSNFGIISTLLIQFYLIITGNSNYYYQNYIAVANIFIILFILFSFLIKSRSKSEALCNINFNVIDFCFALDLFFNFIMIFFSHQKRVSIEDFIYQTSYFAIYLIFRICLHYKPELIISYFNILRILSVIFVSKIIYVVFYKFQMISTDGRINYNSMHPNLLASTFIILAACFIYFVIHDFLEKRFNKYTVFNIIVIFIFILLVIMTSSRGGMLGFALGTGFIFILLSITFRKKLKFSYILICLSVITLILAIFLPNHLDRVKSIFQSGTVMSLGSRISIWQSALDLFIKYPFLGVGPAVCNYDIQIISNSSMIDAHNFLLEKLCNVGMIGTFIYLLPLLLICKNIYKVLRHGSNYGNRFIALNYALIFLLTALFANSSFSPHYVLPLLSMMLYSFLGIYVSSMDHKFIDIEEKNYESFSKSAYNLIVISNLSILVYIILFILFSQADHLLNSEISLWYIPVSLLIGAFIFCFKFMKPDVNNTRPQNIKMLCAPSICYIVIFGILIFFSFYKGFLFFVAEKANGLAISSVMKYSAKPAIKYLDIALENDPTNIAYLINKSNILFISELIKSPELKNNIIIQQALSTTNKAIELFPADQLLVNNKTLMESKYNNSNKDESDNNTSEITVSEMDKQLVLQSGRQSLAKFADLFKDKAYIKYKKTIEKIKEPIIKAIIIESDMDELGSEKIEHLAFLSSILNLCINFDIPFIDSLIINDIGNAMKATESGGKNIPIKSFKQYSKQMQLQNESLANVILLLPAIWKYTNNLDNKTAKLKMAEYFGSDQLFPIINYFIYNDENSLNEFQNYDPTLKEFLSSLVCFANGSYEVAIKRQENIYKKYYRANSVLLSWLYYKAGMTSKARDMIFYSQINNMFPVRRDFTFKRDLLFGGNLMSFYYLPLQSYYNEFIMLALIKMHNGDHTMALKEIFDYLNTVVYNR